MKITKALIVDEPWISYLMDGKKTWEMRSTSTKIRGNVGLIKKGTGTIVAIGNLYDCGSPLVLEEMVHNFDKHQIPLEKIHDGSVSKWVVPWKFSDIRKLKEPIPYTHKQGAVIWVNVDLDIGENDEDFC